MPEGDLEGAKGVPRNIAASITTSSICICPTIMICPTIIVSSIITSIITMSISIIITITIVLKGTKGVPRNGGLK